MVSQMYGWVDGRKEGRKEGRIDSVSLRYRRDG